MRCQRGAAAVEVAIIFPLLLAFVIAIAEYGIYFLTSYTTQEVAYEAARAGSIAPLDDKVTAANAKANGLITELGLSGYNPAVSVTVSEQGDTKVVVSINYQTVTGLSSLPVVGAIFPNQIVQTATNGNFPGI